MTPDPVDVQAAIAKIVASHAHQWVHADSLTPVVERWHKSAAAEVIAALSAAGRLLPEGGEERTEWAEEPNPTSPGDVCRRGDECPRVRFHNYRRTVRTFPDGSEWISGWTGVAE